MHRTHRELELMFTGRLGHLCFLTIAFWVLNYTVGEVVFKSQLWAAAKGHVWVHGPTSARVYVDVHGS